MLKLEWLKRPGVALIAMAVGIVLGIYNRDAGLFLAPVGELYLSFLKMLVVPIMVTAVISSLGKLMASREAGRYLKRTVLTFATGLMLVSLIGMGAGLIARPGTDLDRHAREVLGTAIMGGEAMISSQTEAQGAFTVMDFLGMLIPTNLFQSLVGEQNLQVLFVAMVFGVAIGTVREKKRDDVLDVIEIIYKAFERIVGWTLYGLPVGLLCLMAGQFATMGMDLLAAMTKFIVLVYAVCLLLMLLSALLIWKITGRSVLRSTADLKQPLLIAFGTRNSLATLPFIFQALRGSYRLQEQTVNFVTPLSVILCRYSMVTMFSIGAIFVAQLYGVPLSAGQIVTILFGSVLAALSGAGAPAIVSLSMITMILGPLGLPAETAVVLLLAVTPVVDPVLTMLNVHMACSSSILVDGGTGSTVMANRPARVGKEIEA
jgi:proton glutamate symport protein